VSLISPAYLDSLFKARDETGLAWLSSVICGAPGFDQGQATYGLDPALFLIVEDLLWFAQSVRSGAWTYFEATGPDRQAAMLDRLAADAPPGWSEHYAFGTAHWREAGSMTPLDRWIGERDRDNTAFLWNHLARHRGRLDARLT
jgi:hypothetical protein